MGKLAGRAEERERQTKRAMRWSRWDSDSQFGPRLPSCMTCCLLSNGLYFLNFSPSHGFGSPQVQAGASDEFPASWVRELSRLLLHVHMSAPGFFPPRDGTVGHHSMRVVQQPCARPRVKIQKPIQSATRLRAQGWRSIWGKNSASNEDQPLALGQLSVV